MYKVIGRATLNWSELSEVIMDVEIQMNRRPLSYMETSSFLFQRTSELPEQEPWRVEEKDLQRRAKYLIACKNNLWKRWQREYLVALRERHSLVHKTPKYEVKVGDVVIVKTDSKNRGKWPLAIVEKLFPGPDGLSRAVRVKTEKGVLERPIQHLYTLELSCDKVPEAKTTELNPDARPFRPRRAAAENAAEKIKVLADEEDWTI